MPNLNTAQFTLTGMTAKRSLGDRLRDRWITVKDFGATGNGTTDDTAAVQAAFDYAYGPAGAPNGDIGANAKLNHGPVFFPAGDYKITSTLKLNKVWGANLIGSGSHQTRLFWSGAESGGEDGISTLFIAYNCWNSRFEGITFDASGVQDCAMRLWRWPPGTTDTAAGDDGSDGEYRDCHFTNAATGFLSNGYEMGSERTFINCRFTNCSSYGHRLNGGNALNHSFYGCSFENNGIGASQDTGGSGTANGCSFRNNSVMDIHHKWGPFRVQNCISTSLHFASIDGHIIGCRHVNAAEGIFWTGSNLPMGLPTTGTDITRVVCDGNYSSKGIFYANNSAGRVYLKGNIFSNPNYVSGYLAMGAYAWEDGAAL